MADETKNTVSNTIETSQAIGEFVKKLMDSEVVTSYKIHGGAGVIVAEVEYGPKKLGTLVTAVTAEGRKLIDDGVAVRYPEDLIPMVRVLKAANFSKYYMALAFSTSQTAIQEALEHIELHDRFQKFKIGTS